ETFYGKRVASNARDRRDLVVEGGVDRVHSNASEKRIAVGGRTYNGLGGDIAGSSWSVLDDELLAEPLRPQSITSSARRRNDSGIERSSALAVVRLMIRSNLLGCSTGMSPGLRCR